MWTKRLSTIRNPVLYPSELRGRPLATKRSFYFFPEQFNTASVSRVVSVDLLKLEVDEIQTLEDAEENDAPETRVITRPSDRWPLPRAPHKFRRMRHPKVSHKHH